LRQPGAVIEEIIEFIEPTDRDGQWGIFRAGSTLSREFRPRSFPSDLGSKWPQRQERALERRG
jgi:hypothetical protein